MVGSHLSGVRELLASSGALDRASGAQESSFTVAIATELEEIRGQRCSAALLHERLIENRRRHNLETTPHHVPLSNDPDFRSILLVAQPALSAAESDNFRLADSSSNGSQGFTETNATSMSSSTQVSFTDVRVLIRVSLETPSARPISQEWLSWLKNRPPQSIGGITVSLEKYLRFESLYDSDSLLLLLSMPIALWHALPQNGAYSYVGIVRSKNLLHHQSPVAKRLVSAPTSWSGITMREVDDTASDSGYGGSVRGGINKWIDDNLETLATSRVEEPFHDMSEIAPRKTGLLPAGGGSLVAELEDEGVLIPAKDRTMGDDPIFHLKGTETGPGYLPLYKYGKLISRDSIRLLRLLPANENQRDIDCEILEIHLDSLTHDEDFETRSTSWDRDSEDEENLSEFDLFDEAKTWKTKFDRRAGTHYETLSWDEAPEPPSDTLRLHVGDAVYALRICPSLTSALWALRKRNEVRQLWVEAICINQQDKDERNHLVPMKARIYSASQNVCIWLGDSAEDSKLAMDFVRHRVLEVWKFDELVTTRKMANHWFALVNLMKRPWFSRRWSIHEIALSLRGATIHCGRDFNKWQDFADAVSLFVEVEISTRRLSDVMSLDRIMGNIPEFFSNVSSLGAALLVDATSNLFRHQTRLGTRQPLKSLEFLVSQLSVFEAANPRDTIYALLDFSKDAIPEAYNDVPDPGGDDRKLKLETTMKILTPKGGFHQENYNVDYRLPVIDVYQQFVAFSIVKADKKRALDIICRPWAPTVTKRHDYPAFLISGLWPIDEKPKKKTKDWKREEEEEKRLEAEKKRMEDEKDEETPLPSWIPSLSRAAFEMEEHPTAGLRMERQNADPLVAPKEDSGRTNYTAAGYRGLNLKDLNFVKWDTLRNANSSYPDFSMFVKGFIVDIVATVDHIASNGNIPYRWLQTGGWADTNEYPPEEFWRTLVADRSHGGSNPPTYFERACKESFRFRAKTASKRGGNLDCKKLINEGRCTIVAEFLRRVQEVIWNRKLMRTKSGCLGLVRDDVSPGLNVCVLYGCSVPVILEKVIKSQQELSAEIHDRYEMWHGQFLRIVCYCQARYKIRKIMKARRNIEKEHLQLRNTHIVSREDLRGTTGARRRASWPASEALTPPPSEKRDSDGFRDQAEPHLDTTLPPSDTTLSDEFDDAIEADRQKAVGTFKVPVPIDLEALRTTMKNIGEAYYEHRKATKRREIVELVSRSPHYYRLMGECYVHGMMDGEAIAALKNRNRAGMPDEIFELR
jgi:hypothetical protein